MLGQEISGVHNELLAACPGKEPMIYDGYDLNVFPRPRSQWLHRRKQPAGDQRPIPTEAD